MEPGQPWQPPFNPWLIAATMILPTFMVALDTSVANVALPYMAGSLSSSSEEATWVLTSYLVANAIVLPLTGWMSLYWGRTTFLVASITIFTIASGVCGAAVSLGMLVLARVVQGASGGALIPVSQAVLLESFPPAQRGEAMAAFAMGVIVAPIVGPTLGGWLTVNYSWRWVFYINIPVGILAVLLIRVFIEDPPYIKNAIRGKIDFLGFALMTAGLGSLQLILDRGQQDDWLAAAWIRWSILLSVACFIAFVAWERRVRHPIVDLQVLANRNFAVGILMATTYGVILYGTLVMMPLFLQNLLGYTALKSGLAISPRGIGAMISVTIAGRMVKRIDGRIMILSGFLLLAWVGMLLGRVNLDTTMMTIVWPNVLIGAAMGMIFIPLTTLAVGTLPNEQMGTATGLYNLMRNMGGSIGIAIVSTMLARNAQVHQALMVSHLTPFNPQFQHNLHALTRLFAVHTDPVTAAHRAYGTMYRMLTVQSSLWSYVDNFRMLGYISLLGVPLTFLLRHVKQPKRPRRAVVE